jgi:putative radical SAM enzyme (TIGR03279 family)
MEHRVTSVMKNSIGDELGIQPGDLLLAVDGAPVEDVLDYREKTTRPYFELLMRHGDEEVLYEVERDEDEDLGLVFENQLMDQKRYCRNKCIFCFVDQLPKNARPPLRFKDDDFRLSFLMGNYITLTNVSDGEWNRILSQRISPMYISVHTTDGALRRRIMGNPEAARIRERLDDLFAHRVEFHCQVVMMKGVNDGAVLRDTLATLAGYLPIAQSVAVVPVGLSDHRQGLCKLMPIDEATARETISIVEEANARVGRPFAFCADEFFITAGQEVPAASYYGDFLQVEDGVGMVRIFLDEVEERLQAPIVCRPYRATLVTGKAVYGYMAELSRRFCREYGMELTVIPGENRFFGKRITVSGLLTGGDILAAVSGRDVGECLFIPGAALREDHVFLDDMTLMELETKLGLPVVPIEDHGAKFVERILCGSWRNER